MAGWEHGAGMVILEITKDYMWYLMIRRKVEVEILRKRFTLGFLGRIVLLLAIVC